MAGDYKENKIVIPFFLLTLLTLTGVIQEFTMLGLTSTFSTMLKSSPYVFARTFI